MAAEKPFDLVVVAEKMEIESFANGLKNQPLAEPQPALVEPGTQVPDPDARVRVRDAPRVANRFDNRSDS